MSSIDHAVERLLDASDRERAGEAVPGVSAVLTGEQAAWLVHRMHRGEELRRPGEDPWMSHEGSRVRLAAAMGSALAGARAAAFCSGPDLVSARDQIGAAVSRSLPLVVHASLRAEIAHGVPLGTGHDALLTLADVGAVVLVARDVQEVVDLSVVVRRVAESARVPVVLAMDLDETGRSPASVMLPTLDVVSAFGGDPTQGTEPHDPADAMLFGTLRRRMVRLLDAERPLTLGAVSGGDVWPHAALARDLFEGGRAARGWHDAARAWHRATGRSLERVSVRGASRSRIAIVATGYLAALCERVVGALPGRAARAFRVVTLRALRPLDETAVISALAGAERVAVLERSMAVDDADAPLTRAVRAVMMRALERKSRRATAAPTLKAKDLPDVHAVRIGLGGGKVRATDLATLCLALARGDLPPTALGVDVANTATSYPKRRVLAERLRREFPGTMTDRLHRTDEVAHQTALVDVTGPGSSLLAEALVEMLADAVGSVRALSREGVRGSRVTALSIDGEPVAADDIPAVSVCITREWKGDEEAALGAIVASLVAERPTLPARKLVAVRERALARLSPRERDERMARFRAALEGPERPGGLEVTAAREKRPGLRTDQLAVPARAQRIARHGDTIASLSRFWDHVGVLYADDRVDELSPDPYLGIGALPALSASLAHAEPHALPVLDPIRCTGCGACWTLCPEGALGVTLLTPRELLERGLDEAKRAGSDAGALQMILSKLATGLARVTAGDDPPAHAGDALRRAFEALAGKLPESRQAALREAAGAAATALDRVPVARTRAFTDDAEKEEPGAGALLAIFADPDACTSCGICTHACDADAIPLEPVTSDSLGAARAAWELWSRLPDPTGPTLARASRHADVGLAAATFASRHASMATASARGDGQGSGEMLALRLVLGAVESVRQPVMAELGREVARLRGKLAGEVHDLLAGALPTDDLDALARGLSASDAHEVSLGDIATRLEHAEHERKVDRDRLAAIVDVARRLADLEWRVTTCAGGQGRARAALVVAGEAMAARVARFPDTVFAGPTLVDTSPEAAHTARGVARGLGETLLEDVRLVRRARLLMEHALPEASAASESLATLSWEDLTADERRWCTPLVVLADELSLGESALALVETIVSAGRPAAVVLLSEASADAATDDRELALIGLAAGRAFAVQSSIAAPDHLVQGVRDALGRSSPSIVRVHAPSPRRHGFAEDGAIDRAASAIAARVHPLFRYEPRSGEVLGAGIDLDGNPEPAALWLRDDDARHRTPADWALGEARYTARYRPVVDGATRVTVMEFVGLEAEARRGKSPVVSFGDGELAVDDALVDWCATRLRTWRTLQELAGLVTPFTDRVRTAAEHDVAGRHAAEIETIKHGHARELREAEERVRLQLYASVRERLAALAERGRQRSADPS